jgi:hypothetical protein
VLKSVSLCVGRRREVVICRSERVRECTVRLGGESLRWPGGVVECAALCSSDLQHSHAAVLRVMAQSKLWSPPRKKPLHDFTPVYTAKHTTLVRIGNLKPPVKMVCIQHGCKLHQTPANMPSLSLPICPTFAVCSSRLVQMPKKAPTLAMQ